MTCRHFAPQIETFIDGELDAEQTLNVEEHLTTCEVCSERAELESAIRRSLKNGVRAEATPTVDFSTRLAAAMSAERERILEAPSRPSRSQRPLGYLFPVLSVAAAAALFAFHRKNVEEDMATASIRAQNLIVAETPEQVLDELVDYHAAPPSPQIMEPTLVSNLEPEVGVPLHVPGLKQYGARWEGGGVIRMQNQRAALFRYRLSNHPVTVYVYNAQRMPLRAVLEPRVVNNHSVHVGDRRGYSIAAIEQRGVGYAVATDLNDEESAELVTTALQ